MQFIEEKISIVERNKVQTSTLIIILGTTIIAITFFIALYYLRKSKPVYYKYILGYIVLGLFISTNTFTNRQFNFFTKRNSFLIEQSLCSLQFLMLGLFFLTLFHIGNLAKPIIKMIYISIVLQFTFLINIFLNGTAIYIHTVSNIFLIICSVFYFRDLLNNKPTLILIHSSTFWIVTGIFFFSCVSFPIYSLYPILPKDHAFRNLSSEIFSLANLSVIVLYLFIIKSYLCLKHPQNT